MASVTAKYISPLLRPRSLKKRRLPLTRADYLPFPALYFAQRALAAAAILARAAALILRRFLGPPDPVELPATEASSRSSCSIRALIATALFSWFRVRFVNALDTGRVGSLKLV